MFIFDDRATALVKDVCKEEGLVQERHGGSKILEDHKCQTKGEKNRKASNLRRSLRKCYY